MRTVRDATAQDASACTDIYAPYVTGTAVTFELTPPSTEEMAARIAAAQERHAWLVLVDDGVVLGYAYGGPFRSRPAYRWSCEVSVYLAPAAQGSGAGRALYEALLARLTGRGYRTVLGGAALPNEASERLHRATGFEPVGVFRRVGYKHGRWHDVAWWQLDLGGADPPVEPT